MKKNTVYMLTPQDLGTKIKIVGTEQCLANSFAFEEMITFNLEDEKLLKALGLPSKEIFIDCYTEIFDDCGNGVLFKLIEGATTDNPSEEYVFYCWDDAADRPIYNLQIDKDLKIILEAYATAQFYNKLGHKISFSQYDYENLQKRFIQIKKYETTIQMELFSSCNTIGYTDNESYIIRALLLKYYDYLADSKENICGSLIHIPYNDFRR